MNLRLFIMTKNNILLLIALISVLFSACNDNNNSQIAEQNAEVEKAVTKQPESDEDTQTKTIVFFGNSLTAGYGLEPEQSFPALIQDRLDSLGMAYNVINAGVSGETTSGGKSRIGWLLKQPIDVFVLELGANDGLRGISTEETYNNLASIIDAVRDKNPEVRIILAGMQVPPNMGQKYAGQFKSIYTELAKNKDVALIPFLLEGVAGERALNLPDGIHPTVAGQKIVAANVWNVLKNYL
jgi:acyl-CoA thioesterase I